MLWYHRPFFSTIVGALVTVIGSWVASSVLKPDDPPALSIIVGLLVGVAALQVAELWQFHARTPHLAKLEEALADPELYEHTKSLINSASQLGAVIDKRSYRGLFLNRKTECLSTASIAMQELAGGKIRVTDPDQQYKFAIDLVALATKSVRTISYRDEDFWTIPVGKKYLEHNQRLIAQGGSVERVFVLDEDEILAQRSEIERQIELKISAFVLPFTEQRQTDKEDFVIYDDSFVRYAQPVEFEGSKKQATLSVDNADVKRYLDKFEEIMLRSTPAADYFKKLSEKVDGEEKRWREPDLNLPDLPEGDPINGSDHAPEDEGDEI